MEKGAAQVKFGSEQRLRNNLTDFPGPGSYKNSDKKFCRTFYFDKAKKKDKMNSTVGPGSYKLRPYFGEYDGLRKDQKDILYV